MCLSHKKILDWKLIAFSASFHLGLNSLSELGVKGHGYIAVIEGHQVCLNRALWFGCKEDKVYFISSIHMSGNKYYSTDIGYVLSVYPFERAMVFSNTYCISKASHFLPKSLQFSVVFLKC